MVTKEKKKPTLRHSAQWTAQPVVTWPRPILPWIPIQLPADSTVLSVCGFPELCGSPNSGTQHSDLPSLHVLLSYDTTVAQQAPVLSVCIQKCFHTSPSAQRAPQPTALLIPP